LAAVNDQMFNDQIDRGSVGIGVSTTGAPGDLISFGFSIYNDERGPYFSSLNFTNPTEQLSSGTIFAGIPVGAADPFPRTVFRPEVAISNFSTKPAEVTVTLAQTVAGKTSTELVQKLVLAGQSSRTVQIPAHGDPALTNSLIVRSSLPPGDVVSQFIAWGDFQVRTVELQAKDNDSVQNGGGHPWTIAQGTDSTLLLFNHSLDGPKKFEVLVGNGKQLWVGSYKLASMETKAVKINEIVEKQIPDAKGTKLSKDILTGQVGWWTHRAKWGKGRLMVSQPQSGMARSFSCGTCANLCGAATVYPDDFATVPIGSTSNMGNAAFQQCLATCGACGGTVEGPADETPTWSSLNTSIATVYSGLHSAMATFKGVAAGQTEGQVQAVDEACTARGQGPITVFDLKITGKNYVFVGTDPNELYGNHYIFSDSSGTKTPQPPGGICCAASSDTSDTVNQTSSNPITFQFTTLDQSTTVGDRTLTFEYDLGSQGTSQQMNVTAREFAYATNDSPSNACSLTYGTDRTYTYTVYTHPDHAALASADQLGGTLTTESFNSPPCVPTGNSALASSGQFMDRIRYCSSTPLTCSGTFTQTLKVAGYSVRTNTLTFSNSGVSYTSDGPTQ
jgi:hypothetical protein